MVQKTLQILVPPKQHVAQFEPTSRLRRILNKRLHILQWLPHYTKNDILADFIAGLTVGLTMMPQSIAYAGLAGVSPEYGLYTAFIGSYTYVFFGTIKEVSIGPTSLMSLLTFSFVIGHPIECVILLTFIAGCIELLMGILNLGADVVVDASQEMITLGICNIFGSFVKAMPSCGAFTRSAVASSSDVRTPLQGIYSGKKVDFFLTLATFIIGIINGVEAAIVIGSVFNAMVLLKMWSRPNITSEIRSTLENLLNTYNEKQITLCLINVSHEVLRILKTITDTTYLQLCKSTDSINDKNIDPFENQQEAPLLKDRRPSSASGERKLSIFDLE
ncbi:hypothetical protein NQ314_019074 [Rhamnusium bicolor]|uniref:SLC26A/SulP transporter domain-containing protein n=1 Tax=Rhamnusium bicolor TaxID=1586634 RepID=A0AAV8WNQ1_9CUCU|nr:hypothetical protein NQ314_019074 [Rhamnusium bicolor]